MAIAVRTGEQTRQVQTVCLDELVGDDDLLRRVEQLVASDTVHTSAAPFYGDRFDERALHPALIGGLVQLGCNLALPIVLEGPRCRASRRETTNWPGGSRKYTRRWETWSSPQETPDSFAPVPAQPRRDRTQAAVPPTA